MEIKTMPDFTKEEILRWKKVFEKDYGRELTHEEAYEAAFNWIGFWDLMFKEYIRQNPEEYEKLKKENKSYKLHGKSSKRSNRGI